MMIMRTTENLLTNDSYLPDFRYCFEHVPLENRERVQVNTERCFLRPVDH